MKIQLKSALKMYEQFLNESANEDATVVAPREAMIKDIDSIITSLETLATQVTEDLETEADINEAGEEGAGKKIADFLIFGKKYKKMQQKINTMKIQKADLEFAADGLPGDQKDKKEALRAKAKTVGGQITDLQKLVDDKAKERGSYVQKVLSKTKIEGQMELIKKTAGFTDDKTKVGELKQRMAELKRRAQEEDAAIKQLQDDQKEEGAEENEVDTSDIRNQMRDLRDEAKAEFDKSDKGPEAKLARETKWLKSHQLLLKAATLEKDEELIASTKEDIAESEKDIKDIQKEIEDAKSKEESDKDKAATDEKIKEQEAKIEELKNKQIPEGDKKAEAQNNLSIAKLKNQIAMLKGDDKEIAATKEKVAEYETALAEVSKETSDETATKDADKNSKEGKLSRLQDLLKKAEESGDEEKKKKVQDLIDKVSAKESWQIEGTEFGRLLEMEIVKLENETILNESRYHINSVKDAFSKLI